MDAKRQEQEERRQREANKSFYQELNKNRRSGEKFIVYLTAGFSENSWCPDCNAAFKVIQNEVLDKTQLNVLTMVMPNMKAWRNHPFKQDDLLAAKSIPTLLQI